MQVWCRCITTVFIYFMVTSFFWMFVEGCYLHTAIVMTYSTERLRKWLFLFIGWCEGPQGGGRANRGGGATVKVFSLHFGSKDRTTALPTIPRTVPSAASPLQVGQGEANSPSKAPPTQGPISRLEWQIQGLGLWLWTRSRQRHFSLRKPSPSLWPARRGRLSVVEGQGLGSRDRPLVMGGLQWMIGSMLSGP